MKWYLKCLSNYVNFKGRARRKEYWYFCLFHYILLMVCMGIDNSIGTTFQMFDYIDEMNRQNYGQIGMAAPPTLKYGWFYTIYGLATFLPALGVCWRRMHDTGKNGWVTFIPVYGLIVAFFNSEEGENKYGPNPKIEETA